MDNNNVVKIGTALKWRNTFDLTKKYYQENVVTACGCVFRCKVLQAQGKSPIKMTDDQGHIVYTNTEVWDVLVDMAYYYNFAVDTRKLTQQTLDYVKKLDEAFQKQQKEIAALQKDNKDQWDHINDIEKINAEQQRELNSIHDTISCFSEGIWIDTLLWSDVTIWDNNKYAITDDLQDQINVLTENHNQDIEDLTDKHNSELSALTTSIINQNNIQDGINNYLQDQVYDLNNTLCCFSTGVWENDLHWSEILLWDNNKYAITDALAEDIKNAMLANAKEHGSVNDHLRKHDDEIKDLQDLIEEHDQQIIDLLDTLSCFSNGYWDNDLKWSNQTLWENSNLMYDTLESIDETFTEFKKEHESFRKEHKAITDRLNDHDTLYEEQQREIDSLLYRISILTNGVWDNALLWNNDSEWSNTDPNEELTDLSNDLYDTRYKLNEANEDIMTNLSLIQANHQLIEGNTDAIQEMLDDIRSYNGCFEKGEWANPFFWNDTDKWYNSPDVVSEVEAEIIGHDSRLTALESQVALILQQFAAQQTIIEQQQTQLETFMDCFTVLNVGRWQNLLLWDNTSKWSDVLITEAAADGGIATVAVKSYDSETETVSI